jgi:ribosome-binding protein aMBF1 (putative translation factor)
MAASTRPIRQAQGRPCEICGQPIEPQRIEVNPATRLCIEHHKMIGKYGGEFKISSREDKTSKEGSLKKNYGGVTTSVRRNEEAIARLRAEYRGSQ